MELFHYILLAIIEGFTEFLPISSTGHLILASHLLGIPEDTLLSTFKITVQFGAILAVVFYYWKKLLDIKLLSKLCVAFIPTGVLGVTIYSFIKEFLHTNEYVVIVSLFVGGVIMILVERFHTQKRASQNEPEEINIHAISYRQALYLGLYQSIAMIPGVSRSGATIIGGLLMNIPRRTLAEFTFLLAVPTMSAGALYDVLKSYKEFSSGDVHIILIGIIVSFFVALLSIKVLLGIIKRYSFEVFGWYRIALAVVWALVFFV